MARNRSETRGMTNEQKFKHYGCDEMFEYIGDVDGKRVAVRCRNCGNEFTRVDVFLHPSKNHNIMCRKCGIHADSSVTPPQSEIKVGIEGDIAGYYAQGFSIGQTAAKFKVNARRVSKIVNEAGIRRSPQVDPDEARLATLRARNRETVVAQPKEKRIRTIHERFEKHGCDGHFEIAEITNRTHVIIRCLECGYEFKRETSFLNNEKYSNIGCPNCGVHADGTYSTAKEFKKEVDEEAIVECYEKGFSVRIITEKFKIHHERVNIILDKAGVIRREDEHNEVTAQDYVHEITGDSFMDEEFVCANCGREFTRYDYMVNAGRKKVPIQPPDYCSKKCSQKASNRLRRQIGTSGQIKHARNSRAESYKIPLGDLIERYDGICQACGEKVDLTDISYDENGHACTGAKYPTKDHIVPIVRGGKTTWDNVQLLCKGCNNRKHTMTMDEFMALSCA